MSLSFPNLNQILFFIFRPTCTWVLRNLANRWLQLSNTLHIHVSHGHNDCVAFPISPSSIQFDNKVDDSAVLRVINSDSAITGSYVCSCLNTFAIHPGLNDHSTRLRVLLLAVRTRKSFPLPLANPSINEYESSAQIKFFLQIGHSSSAVPFNLLPRVGNAYPGPYAWNCSFFFLGLIKYKAGNTGSFVPGRSYKLLIIK